MVPLVGGLAVRSKGRMMKTLAGIALIFLMLAGSAIAEPRRHQGGGWDKGRSHHGGHYRHYRPHYRYPDPVTSFWGGVLGGAVGTWWSQANRPQTDPDLIEMRPWTDPWFRFCTNKYRSFDPETGTYLAYDGNRYFCK